MGESQTTVDPRTTKLELDPERRAESNRIDGETRCPECEGRVISDGDRGESACRDCGLVVEEARIDPGPEWRTFDGGPSRGRVGAPMTYLRHDNGLSTTIDWRNRDAYGNQLSATRRRLFGRLRCWDERFVTRDGKERNLKHALGEIDRMASSLGIPAPCRETAGVIYRQALERDLLPGRTIEGVATASLYAAARKHGTPRTFVEVETVSRVDKTRIQRAYRYLDRELELQIEPADPQQYVSQFASAVDVSEETECLMRDLVTAAKAAAIHNGRSPAGIAAASLYAAGRLTNEGITQEAVSDATHVSLVTIRNRYTEVLEAYQQPG